MKSRFTITQLQNTSAARNPANKALFSNEGIKEPIGKDKEAGSEGNKANKYNNRKVSEDGETFDSIKEAKRAKDLRMLLRTGKIK